MSYNNFGRLFWAICKTSQDFNPGFKNKEIRIARSFKICRQTNYGHKRKFEKQDVCASIGRFLSKYQKLTFVKRDGLKLLDAKERQSESPEPQRKPENLTQRAQTQQDDYEQSPEPKEKERTNYIKTEPAERGPSPVPFPQNYYTIIRKNSVNKNTDEHRPLDLDSMRKAAYNFQKTKRSDSVQPARKPALNTKTNQ